jgi:hypothetical protein
MSNEPVNANRAERNVSYVVSIWRGQPKDSARLWHGYLETVAGQRFEFATLAELNHLLCELGGWNDPPPTATAWYPPAG